MKRGRQKLGQHFLRDSSIVRRIIEAADIGDTSDVLEIGPGRGALTGQLYETARKLTLIEPDPVLAEKISKDFPEATVIQKRAEAVDFSELGNELVVVANLPYYASVRIFKHCVKNRKSISRMVLMFQKEVGERLIAEPGRKSYGSLSLFCRFHWESEEVLKVPPKSFAPPPKVESAVLKFLPLKEPPVRVCEEPLFRLIRTAFTHKRRTLKNNLKSLYKTDSIERALLATELGEMARAETVSIKQFACMLDMLVPLNHGTKTG